MPGQALDIKGIELTATDSTPPTITPDETTTNVVNESGRWIRGTWDASFSADSQAGVCQAWVAVDGSKIATGRTYTPATGSWTQCGAGAGTIDGSGANSVAATLDTARYANGALTIQDYAADPAQPANVAAPTYKVNIDNTPVGLSLNGPTQALSNEGQQIVSAAATAGPSGVSGILCSINGSPPQWHGGASESIAVSNLGINTIACVGENTAINPEGSPAVSPVQRWTVDIRNPSVSLVSLAHVANALRCVRSWARLHVPARWITERYHGHRIRVHVPAQTRRVRVQHCHPRVRMIRTRRGSRTVVERIVELPRRVGGTHQRVAFGRRTTVRGWLGTPAGNALAGQTVDVLTAPANGSGNFTVAAMTKTGANGTWSARLPPGPSRLIEARYGGTAVVAPSVSTTATVSVPASVTVNVTPRATHWGRTIEISGRLRGGYIPASGELVVLRIGWNGGSAEIGHVYTDRGGRFRASYTFLRGTGSEAYRIWAQTVRESDYPFAPASSRKVSITVNP